MGRTGGRHQSLATPSGTSTRAIHFREAVTREREPGAASGQAGPSRKRGQALHERHQWRHHQASRAVGAGNAPLTHELPQLQMLQDMADSDACSAPSRERGMPYRTPGRSAKIADHLR